jgi:hypothetical protein
MKEIRFACPQCGKQLAMDRADCGATVACPFCSQTITVPGEQSAATPALPKKKRPIFLYILGFTAGIFLIAMALGLIACAVNRSAVQARIGSKLEALRKEGEPVSMAELNVYYPEPPPGSNRAPALLAAYNLIHELTQYANNKNVPLLGQGELPPPDKALPPEMSLAIHDIINTNRDALNALIIAAAPPMQCRYPLDFNAGPGIKLTHVRPVILAAKLSTLYAIDQAEAGNAASAVEGIQTCLGLAHSLDNEPVILSVLVRLTAIHNMRDGLERTLNRASLTSAQLRQLQQALAGAEAPNLIARGLELERTKTISLTMKPAQELVAILGDSGYIGKGRSRMLGPVLGATRLAGNRDAEALLDYYEEAIRISRLPFPARLDARFNSSERLLRAKGDMLFLFAMLAPQLDNHVTGQEEAAGLAQLRIGQAACAVEQWRAAHNKDIPASLDALGPEFLEHAPTDPFNGQPLRIEKSGAGYVIYSVGLGKMDNSASDLATNAKRGHIFIRMTH